MNAARLVTALRGPIDITVRPPGSKSETVRALAVAAMCEGRSHLYGPLDADDPRAMSNALGQLGVVVGGGSEPWSVDGRGGRLRAPTDPLDANESGLSARILLAMAGSIDGTIRMVGRGRLPERPMGGIVDVLRAQGVEVSGDRLPIDVVGRGGLWGGPIAVDCTESSQFATAVMIVAPMMHESSTIELVGLEGSAGYLDGTVSIMRSFGATVDRTVTGYEVLNSGYRPSDVVIEPDASAAVYPMAVAAITGGRVVIEGLGERSWQPDLRVAHVLATMGCRVDWDADRVIVDARDVSLTSVEVDMSEAPDGALALAVVCLFAEGESRITGLGSLRHKESDRLDAISEGIARLGGSARIDGETLMIAGDGGALHGAVIDPHGDHRIAMALATAGTAVSGVGVADPHVVHKTWPGYWSFLDSLTSA